jgi:nitrate reductase NapE component
MYEKCYVASNSQLQSAEVSMSRQKSEWCEFRFLFGIYEYVPSLSILVVLTSQDKTLVRKNE